MEKIWSFNTTIRNPERMENMLRALAELEGKQFDLIGQELFFGLQIKKRLYKPTKKTLGEPNLIREVYVEDSADDLDDEIVKKILEKYKGKSVDASGRGRTAAGILNRFGLCIALQSKGQVIITDLAKRWLKHEISDEELFSKFLLKWQYPNEIEAGYNDFNIKPFVGVLSLIKKVNEKWESLGNKSVGLSKYEYQLFALALSNTSDISEYAVKIINFRKEKETKMGKDKSNFMRAFALARANEISGSSKDPRLVLSDLKDYMDSSIRYFRVSGLIALRGKDTHVDIATDKKVEVESILKTISPEALDFSSEFSYFDYLSNQNSLELPWQNNNDLEKISVQLLQMLKMEAAEIKLTHYLSMLEGVSVVKKVQHLKDFLNEVRIQKLKDLKHNITVLDESVTKLQAITQKKYETLTARPSLDLEWYISRAIMVLNDALEIKPSFSVGDDGIPTGFRPNVSDIECYYDSFGMTVEVTLLLGRDQWIAEGQPVMRHFRDFEDKVTAKKSYCLFIAPLIHRDTLNTFWMGNKFNYEGRAQNVIPLTLVQFIEILKIAKGKINTGNLGHKTLEKLFESISGRVGTANTAQEWLTTFPSIIKEWSSISLP